MANFSPGVPLKKNRPVSSFAGPSAFSASVEYRFAGCGALMQCVYDFHCLVGINVVVPHQAQSAQRVAAPVAFVHREQQPPVIRENRVVYDLRYGRIHCIGHVFLLAKSMCAQKHTQSQGDCRHFFHCFLPPFLRRPHYKQIEASSEVSICWAVFTCRFIVRLLPAAWLFSLRP